MAYTKPEIRPLGEASSIVRNGEKFPVGIFDPDEFHLTLQPAYDLDE